MRSPDAQHTTLTVFAMSGALLLAACGGGEGTPRPEDTAGAGGTGATGGSGGGAGMAAGTGGSAGAPVGECPTPTEWTGGSIATVEMDGDRLDSNKGGWYFFHAGVNDGCPTCMTTPAPPVAPATVPTVVLEEPDPARSGSTKALHWVGTGWVDAATYGAGVGIYLDNCANALPAVTGVSFYYMSDTTITFGSTQANIPYQKDFPATDSWTQANVAFTDLIPETGSGTLDQSKIVGFFWRVPKPATGVDGFSVWLDDIEWIGGS